MRYLLFLSVGFVFLLLFCGCGVQTFPFASAFAAEQVMPGECVVLLHGMGRTSRSMDDLEEALEEKGYKVANIDYPSREYPIQHLSSEAVAEGIRLCTAEQSGTIHFVTHSMGGILVRYYLKHNDLEELGRVVMLSPPNKGSEVTDALADNFLYRMYFGEAGLQLGTGPDSFVMQLGAVTYPTGIIIGTEHSFFDGWFSTLIPGEDDGKVSVMSTRVAGMSGHIALPVTHTFMMNNPLVMAQVGAFLRDGRFDRDLSITSVLFGVD